MDVLVVEDEPLVRAILAEGLEDAGLSVAAAASADLALAAAAHDPPPVVVADVDLGPNRTDGLALAVELRRRWPGLGVVYVTGRPSRLNGHTLGIRDRFLVKPFAPAALVRAVRELMALPAGPALR